MKDPDEPRATVAPADAVRLLADGLALTYHEARHVRVLTRAGHLEIDEWAAFIDLPRDRVEAWRTILPRRQAASLATDGRAAEAVFEAEYGKPTAALAVLFSNRHWLEAAVAGEAWRRVAACVLTLRDSLGSGDAAESGAACARLVNIRLEDGRLRDRIAGLDRAIGYATDPLWRSIWLEP